MISPSPLSYFVNDIIQGRKKGGGGEGQRGKILGGKFNVFTFPIWSVSEEISTKRTFSKNPIETTFPSTAYSLLHFFYTTYFSTFF